MKRLDSVHDENNEVYNNNRNNNKNINKKEVIDRHKSSDKVEVSDKSRDNQAKYSSDDEENFKINIQPFEANEHDKINNNNMME